MYKAKTGNEPLIKCVQGAHSPANHRLILCLFWEIDQLGVSSEQITIIASSSHEMHVAWPERFSAARSDTWWTDLKECNENAFCLQYFVYIRLSCTMNFPVHFYDVF